MYVWLGILLTAAFVLWTVLVQTVDVRPVGQNGTDIGFAALNCRFHALTGVNMILYAVTDLLEIVPLAVCVCFAAVGFMQMVRRKSVLKVDPDILLLGAYYLTVVLCYFMFEKLIVNYRPVPIGGRMEASYPSSTVLLVLSVMPTLTEQLWHRAESKGIKIAVSVINVCYCAFMVFGRTICGVHWLTDIIGAILPGAGLYAVYKGLVSHIVRKQKKGKRYGIE